MGFFVFLIILILIFHTQAVMRFFGILVGLALAGLAAVALFFCVSFGRVDSVGICPADLEATVVQMVPQAARDELAGEIDDLRTRVHSETDPGLKALLTNHLERLEKMQRQRDNEREALKRLRDDQKTLRQVRQTRQSLEVTRQKLATELEKLDRLEDEVERSRRFMEKYLNDNETPLERK